MFRNTLYDLVLRYKTALGEDITMEQLEAIPYPDIIQSHWEARAYFKEPGWYTKLEKADTTLQYISVVNKKGIMNYRRSGKQWIFVGDLNKSMYKE